MELGINEIGRNVQYNGYGLGVRNWGLMKLDVMYNTMDMGLVYGIGAE